jgi:hypothetical protein
MAKDLTTSAIDRQNILNNRYAIEAIREETGVKAILFRGEYRFTNEQVAGFFEVDIRTVERYIENYREELVQNGFQVLRGKSLQAFKLWLEEQHVTDINVGHKVVNLALFNFRAFLNMAMLLVESEKARVLRSVILATVIDTLTQRTGGGTKYINQRDEDFIISFMKGYAIYTNKIYVSIFKENALEYRQILKLHEKENVRNTMYSEVLRLISSYETGFAEVLQKEYQKLGRKLQPSEVDQLFNQFEQQRLWVPQVEDARNKMASRDLGFRDALHIRLKEYITAIEPADFDRFLGEKSKSLEERLEEMKDIFKRLKERQ